MIQADLHVHSSHSAHPSEWFLRKIGTRESYTGVETVYRQAKERGMTYVTLTDHNTIAGALELTAAHPGDTFVSAEITGYFPEDGCKVHLLTYDIDEAQFKEIDRLRTDIYRLRDFLRDEHIACSVAHATYSVNGRLSLATIEKLILLFNVFESINGTRGHVHNASWTQILQRLTPADIERLQARHGIEPWGPQPWRKGFTGGSDDHAGLMIGATYTVAPDASLPDFVHAVRDRETLAGGRHGDHKSLAFAVYKIAYEFSRTKTGHQGEGVLGLLNTLIFNDSRPGFKNWLALRKLRTNRDSRAQALSRFFDNLSCGRDAAMLPEERVEAVFSSLCRLSDDFFELMAVSIEQDIKNGRPGRLLQNLSSALPALFMIAPFFTTMRHTNGQHRALINTLRATLDAGEPRLPRRLLWFSDTVVDLNGVAVTMRELAASAARTGRPLKLVTSLPPEDAVDLPESTLNLPCIYTLTPEFYTAYTLRLPAVLSSMDMIERERPDEIVVSTPGPVGILGLIASRLLGVPCTGIYHTDFARQADYFIGDESISAGIESYVRWFFEQMDTIRVPTQQYIGMLAQRGLDPGKMRLFRRGISRDFAVDDADRQAALRARYAIEPHETVLLWAGRLGKEKNLDFLLDVFEGAAAERKALRLIVAGDGPELEHLRRRAGVGGAVVFTGRVDRAELPHLYHIADQFVFPSTTDTFGMVVLEAQACGVPAIVTDVGGPQEIVENGETGFVVPADNIEAWVAAVVGLVDVQAKDRDVYTRMAAAARARCLDGFGWERVLDDMMGAADVPDLLDAPGPEPRKRASSPATVA
jgi:glycosyltransferase involved in cell wall biosynthesis